MDTTPEYWAVDGVSLQTYAYNITTLGGDRQAPPSLRGDNVTIPHSVGTTWKAKVPDSRTITLAMWTIGADSDGLAPVGGDREAQFRKNWEMLRKLLWTPYRQLVLTKRILNRTTGLYETVTAKAQFSSGLNPTLGGKASAIFTVDLYLADPFFYGASKTISLPAGGTASFTAVGDDRAHDVQITFSGGLTNPKLTNLSETALWVRYGAVVAAGETAVLGVRNFTSVHTPGAGAPYKSGGYITHAGDHHWMYLDPKPCQLQLTADSGAGSAQVTYLPRWL